MVKLHGFGRIDIVAVSRFVLRLMGRGGIIRLQVVIEFSCKGSLHQSFNFSITSPKFLATRWW